MSYTFKIIAEAMVDDEPWYTVHVPDSQCAQWIRTFSPNQQWQHGAGNPFHWGYFFDIDERLYTLLALKWSQRELHY
jgi:hypothetical protein